MYSLNLNGSYEYESERRSDERRAAAESQRLRGLTVRHWPTIPALLSLFGIVALVLSIAGLF